jgi:hypothetical protein
LVGRIVVDLSLVLNNNAFNDIADHKLAFCSIPNSSLTFNVQKLSITKTELKAIELDLDEFS